MVYCTQTQVEQRLQIDFASDTDPVVAELIAAASGHIDRITGRPLEDDSRTETFDAPDTPDLWLTHTPVNSITSVTVDGTALATSGAYTLDGDIGRLTRTVSSRPRSWATHKLQTITVAYDGGYDPVPYDVQDICARMAARAFQAGAAFASSPNTGVKKVSLDGSDSVEFTDTVSDISMSVFITEDEIEALRVYRSSYLA